ncbi:MAG TPA: cytochrome c [Devosia sp.]
MYLAILAGHASGTGRKRMRGRLVATTVLIVAVGGGSLAADDPVAQRRAWMRDNAKAERTANSAILGKFQPDKVTAAMQKIETNMATFVTLFPSGSETGGETHADPAIWERPEEFRAMSDLLVEQAKAASIAAATGQDAFALAWTDTAAVCAACHATFAPAMTQ